MSQSAYDFTVKDAKVLVAAALCPFLCSVHCFPPALDATTHLCLAHEDAHDEQGGTVKLGDVAGGKVSLFVNVASQVPFRHFFAVLSCTFPSSPQTRN